MKLYTNRQLLVLMGNQGIDMENTIYPKFTEFYKTIQNCYYDNDSAYQLVNSFNKIWSRVSSMLLGMIRAGMKVADEPMLKSAFN